MACSRTGMEEHLYKTSSAFNRQYIPKIFRPAELGHQVLYFSTGVLLLQTFSNVKSDYLWKTQRPGFGCSASPYSLAWSGDNHVCLLRSSYSWQFCSRCWAVIFLVPQVHSSVVFSTYYTYDTSRLWPVQNLKILTCLTGDGVITLITWSFFLHLFLYLVLINYHSNPGTEVHTSHQFIYSLIPTVS